MDDLLKIAKKIIRKKYNPWGWFFKIENSSQDNFYGATIKVIALPESDAVLTFLGTGISLEEAVKNLTEKVVLDEPEKGELG